MNISIEEEILYKNKIKIKDINSFLDSIEINEEIQKINNKNLDNISKMKEYYDQISFYSTSGGLILFEINEIKKISSSLKMKIHIDNNCNCNILTFDEEYFIYNFSCLFKYERANIKCIGDDKFFEFVIDNNLIKIEEFVDYVENYRYEDISNINLPNKLKEFFLFQ